MEAKATGARDVPGGAVPVDLLGLAGGGLARQVGPHGGRADHLVAVVGRGADLVEGLVPVRGQRRVLGLQGVERLVAALVRLPVGRHPREVRRVVVRRPAPRVEVQLHRLQEFHARVLLRRRREVAVHHERGRGGERHV